MTVLLTLGDLLSLIEDLAVGPVRDVGVLASVAHRPGAVAYGHEAYPDVDSKAAAVLDSLVGDHALVDGNERLGWPAVVVFYGLNEIDLDAPDDPSYELVMSVARGEMSIHQIAAALARWHSPQERDERFAAAPDVAETLREALQLVPDSESDPRRD